MKNGSKIFGMLLAVCILFSCFTAEAHAVDLNQLSFKTNNDGTVTISDCDENAVGDLVIPDTIGGRQVTAIGSEAFKLCSNITSVTLPATVTKIGNQAFYSCTGLKSIVIQGNPTSIGSNTFKNCTSLTSITIPDSVSSIGEYAFYNCSSLPSIKLPKNLTKIEQYTFDKCTSLASVSIPSGVTSIGTHAFSDCGLKSVVIPASVTQIWDNAFNGCSALAEVTLNEGLQKIWYGAFTDCSSLKTIAIPDTVTSFGGSATGFIFENCKSLITVYIGKGVKEIGYKNFINCTNLQKVYIHSETTAVNYGAFYNCPSLTDVYFCGTSDQWLALKMEDDNNSLLLANVHYIDSFKDVATAAWYGPAVHWAVGQKITSGVGNNAFAPSRTCTNAQVITFLWNAAGKPSASGSSPLTKVQNTKAYYYTSCLWAYQKGIITDLNFDPDAPATRSSFVTCLWRYKGKPSSKKSNPFTDIKSSDEYYIAVMWALENNITAGTSATTFSPDKTCTRAQIVQFLYNYFER